MLLSVVLRAAAPAINGDIVYSHPVFVDSLYGSEIRYKICEKDAVGITTSKRVRGGMSAKKMLIIDDNSTIRDLLAADFEDDYIVETAVNGKEGLSAAITNLPDVILLDINMPDISGIDVLCELSSNAETRNIPIVVVTAGEHNVETERQLRGHKNFRGFLSKMDSIEKIKETVKLALH